MTNKRLEYIISLKDFLDSKVAQFNRPGFIELDPISIPHQYKKQQDIEIAGLLTATLSWGQRVTIVKKSHELLSWMDDSPHDFLLHHTSSDLKPFEKFKHRTFNATDTLYFISSLKKIYQKHTSLEDAFLGSAVEENVGNGLINFNKIFFSLPDFPERTKKHVSTPERKSACKRINMYLRWMVRKDIAGVDFGLWKRISPSQLIIPLDLHVARVARKLKLVHRKQMDWEAALELTANLRILDPMDPVKYDFALFGLGVEENF